MAKAGISILLVAVVFLGDFLDSRHLLLMAARYFCAIATIYQVEARMLYCASRVLARGGLGTVV